ncbi:hypothetical protein EVA_14463 [gut metagenome]|uniref:Uncharacterized protein n=1 Tax=gut metagenome TaxID=749906 RepID=J9FR44_9ZZZZ
MSFPLPSNLSKSLFCSSFQSPFKIRGFSRFAFSSNPARPESLCNHTLDVCF